MTVRFSKAKIRIFIGILLVFVFFLGLLIGHFSFNSKESITIQPIRDPANGYQMIDPILYTDVPESLSFPKYAGLDAAIAAYVKSTEAAGKVTDMGVYFRDLNSNDWVGTNYTDQFDGASMLKVVTLMALLRASESSPNIMNGNIAVPAGVVIPSTDEQDYFPPADPVTSGKTYSIQNLMFRLITQSDNGANALLINFLGGTALTQVFTDLHIPAPGSASTTVSPQEYSHLFRVLYNASYLDSPDSETALQLLSQTTFTSGLAAGVPATTTVAHKFGESTSSVNGVTIHELHDCGIVYYPGHPYFLCVMTRGSDFPTLVGVIKGMSQLVWKQVDQLS